VQWEVASDETFRQIMARGSETAEAAWAHSVHAEPGGLAPGRWYWYRFRALGQQSPAGRTRTAPAADAAATLKTAIASCQRYDHGEWAAWQHMATQDLDLVMFLGDYIYEYASAADAVRPHDGGLVRTLEQYRRRYFQYKREPALQAAHAAFPWLLIADDHEVENDYGADRSPTLSGPDLLALRSAAFQAWWEHQPLPKAMRPAGPDLRMHRRLDWGRLARIHALDDRQHRDPHACVAPRRVGGAATLMNADCPALFDPKRSLLGAAQEGWLAEGWDPQRRWNLLAQQTLMARFNSHPDGRSWTDGWDGYAASRQRLLGSVVERKIPGVVVLGGDVHANFVADLKIDFDDAKSPVVASEFCGTSISSRGRAQSNVDAALALNPHLHLGRADQRGYVTFVIDDRQLSARLMVVDRPQDASSPVHEAARFVVDPLRPGPQRG
jgi:alkaline phosphatase D